MVPNQNYHFGMETHTGITQAWYNCLICSALPFNHLAIQNKPHNTVKHGFCNLSGYNVFMALLNGSLDGCCWTILSLVQFLFSFVNNRMAKFPLSKKAILVTQSFMRLRDNTKQIMVNFHTLKSRWFKV